MAVDIPNYRVVEKLGVGAQTRIFRARCMRTGKDYTVKIVKVRKPEDASFIDLLKTEHAIGTNINDPVIRKVYELRMMRHRLRVRGAILFMEFVDGISMAEKEFRRPIEDVLNFFVEAARGLGAMHQAGYVHADLKPGNIMITNDDTVKLIDLGQSALINEPKQRIQGTIDYMAPEQVRRESLDQRTDVFGLGATLFKVLTRTAIQTQMNNTIGMHSQNLVGKRVSKAHGGGMTHLPVSVARLIEDCCQPDPDDRIKDMATLMVRFDLVKTALANQAVNGSQSHDDEDPHDLGPDDNADTKPQSLDPAAGPDGLNAE